MTLIEQMQRSGPCCDTLSSVQKSVEYFYRQPLFWIVFGLVAALLVKYGWPLLRFDLPMGYDTGFYRYLFIRHADAFPPFWIADLDPWAREHPLGLFFFSTILIRLGIPVDWLIGWAWNLFAVILLCTLSWTAGKRFGRDVGIWTLVACLLSVSSFDGFAAMYWKTFASMFWCVLAFRSIERRSWWTVPFGIFAVATHQQTGLLFGLVILSYLALPFIPFSAATHPLSLRRIRPRDLLLASGALILLFAFGLLVYLPVWTDVVMQHLPALLGKTEVSSGSFPPPSFYLLHEGCVLLAGILGFVLNVRKERWTPWQLAVLWSLLFVVARLLFYRRFFLQLEFFLLPFAGIGFAAIWKRFPQIGPRSALFALLVVQLLLMRQAILRHGPVIDEETFAGIVQIESAVEDDAAILSLENDSPVMLRGWYPYRRVGGPGLFDAPWTKDEWIRILIGTHEERVALFQRATAPLYLFVSPLFRSFYASDNIAESFLSDPCFDPVPGTMLYRVVCIDTQLPL